LDELRTNTTLRIAAIAFAIFVVVGTVLIFAFPDDEPATTDTTAGVPTIGALNQTRIASYNATAQASTPTP
jgi:hypothetical protein